MNNSIFKLSIFFLCLFSSQVLVAQNPIQKAINSALAADNKSGKYYVAETPEKKQLNAAMIKKHCKDKYVVRNIKTQKKQLFGQLKTVVVSFEFRDVEEIKQEKIAAEKRRKEFAAAEKIRKEKRKLAAEKRRKELAAAEKRRKEKERIAFEEAAKNKPKDTSVSSNSNANNAFKSYGYDFEIFTKTNLPEELFLKDSKTDPFVLLNVFTKDKMYMSAMDNKESQKVTIDCYHAKKNNKAAYYLHGFNRVTQKEEHFLLEPGATTYVVTNLTIAPDAPKTMYKSDKSEFEKLLGVSDLKGKYAQNDYPKITKLSGGIWGQTKVELGEDFYYIVDNQWDYDSDLSCYDKCYSCDFFGGKSNKSVETKDLAIFCQNKLLGRFILMEISACNRRVYSHNGSNSFFGGGEYRTEVDAITNLLERASKECIVGETFYTSAEKQQQANKERAKKNYENGGYSQIYPDDEDLDQVKTMNISKEELMNHKWRLADGQTYEFNDDGTSVFNADKEYIDLWKLTDDSLKIEIEFQPPHYDAFLNMTMVYCSILSIVKEGEEYFLYRADTSKGVGNCIKCPISKISK